MLLMHQAAKQCQSPGTECDPGGGTRQACRGKLGGSAIFCYIGIEIIMDNKSVLKKRVMGDL